jgi:hypothetical protein
MKTAVEWLESQLTEYLQRMYKFEINQAKEIEKQQIIDARVKKPLDTEWLEAEQYYNERFKKQNNEN